MSQKATDPRTAPGKNSFVWYYLQSHFIPWCMSPYKRDPQWSQNVGLP